MPLKDNNRLLHVIMTEASWNAGIVSVVGLRDKSSWIKKSNFKKAIFKKTVDKYSVYYGLWRQSGDRWYDFAVKSNNYDIFITFFGIRWMTQMNIRNQEEEEEDERYRWNRNMLTIIVQWLIVMWLLKVDLVLWFVC